MHVHVLDANHAELFGLTTNEKPASTNTQFSKNMPDHRLQYRWFDNGRFPSWKFNLVGGISLTSSC